ncbi:MAG TPA: hypothetical protein VL362_02295 [Patescibacteria group bacterium]|jgi:hypothetical protein|nr:hypothetical protein [Patescibacteria group bacterium]
MANEPDLETQAVLAQINQVARELFTLLRQRGDAKEAYKSEQALLKQEFVAADAEFERKIVELKQRLLSLVKQNLMLLQPHFPRKKSFTTAMYVIKLTAVQSKTSVRDAKAVLELARTFRKPRIVSRIAKIKVSVSVELVESKFLAWLESHPEYYELFEPLLDVTPAGESVSAKPNEGLIGTHGTEAITIKAENIGLIQP